MKRAVLFLSGLILSAFVSGPAAAEVVRVRVTARVSHISDTNNVLAGKVVIGQRVNGLYVYNTNTPNQAPFPGFGDYRPYANEARVRFAMGSLVFESAQPTQGIGILVRAENGSGNPGLFNVMSSDNKPLADGTIVAQLQLLLDGLGNVTQSVALPTVAPIVQTYGTRQIVVRANAPTGSYIIDAQVEAAELVIPDAIVVTPASGTFVANQHFDAAVILPRNSVVSTAQATVNGVPVGLSYPGTCQLQPQVGTGKPSILCPSADAAIPVQPDSPIDWTVTLTNGTVYTESVTWERSL